MMYSTKREDPLGRPTSKGGKRKLRLPVGPRRQSLSSRTRAKTTGTERQRSEVCLRGLG